MSNTFNVCRSIWTDPQFSKEPFTKREAWLWLISEASWKDRQFRIGKYVFDLKRGQLAASTRGLAEVWQWTDSKVRRFLDMLKAWENIDAVATHGATVITICNYERYQNKNGSHESQTDALATQYRRTSDAIQNKEEIPEENKPPKSPLEGEAAAPPKKSRSKQNQIDRPEEVPEQLWKDFLLVRKQHRAPFTQTAFEGFQREAAAANLTLSQAITIATERGWRGFKAEWVKPEDMRAVASEPSTPDAAPVEIGGRTIKRAGVVEALRRFYEDGQWSTHTFSVLGPAPGQENCLIPDDVIQEARSGNLIQFPGAGVAA